jgi:dTDP-4-dehydrorhamnose reductase
LDHKKIAVFGWNGLVGSYIVKTMQNDYSIIKISRSASGSDYLADASDFSKVSRIIKKEKPDLVINAVKNNLSTDQCEADKPGAWAANVSVPENMARLQPKFGYQFIHISTDWVYEGKNGETYDENSFIYPQNFYSYSKAVAEERVRCLAEDSLILRPTGIFGIDPRGANFFMRVMDSMAKKERVSAPTDQYSQPIFAGELARIIKIAVAKKARGTYNAVGPEYLSRYDLAARFCDVFGWDKTLLSPVTSSNRAIRIPQYLKVDITKLEKDIGRVNALQHQISSLKNEIENRQS